ncbi:beta-ketoacyl-[acyl-carrier-protein] synthase II [candidate division WOR-3 bacterium RBG_13_43_14]|uniref:3-oxoacyl-[acyl-carrier-protein] synthase 2 n=1 Tax=candidate division WOR-3 bacterium RBG_13_43_14 TaxID=1802590 RepID=A0A1F4U9K1_UNCW3|nr:MAG: beta-ketoacyl-[acyl-carrier-protein] synthase II [candidate division WOR-3 bacterium RBG_13_43_14]
MRRVVITGMGMLTPVGNDVKSTWENLLQVKTGINRITAFDVSNHSVKIAGEVKDFHPETKYDPKTLKRLDRFVHFALAATDEAIADSGIDLEQHDRSRIGVIYGCGIGGLRVWEGEHIKFQKQGPSRVSPLLIPMMIPDMTAGYIAIHWHLGGPNYSTVSACASGAHAIGDAFRMIRYGDADAMITGGSEAPLTPFALAGFSNMRALSRRNDEPHRASRPFDRDRDGFVMAEGAGTIVLEELEFAKKRSAKIYAEIVGYGATGDGYHMTAPAPGGEGARRAMARAIEEAGIKPQDIGYINAHGTSTDLNDKYEIKAIVDLFGDNARKLMVNSTKSMIGHMLGAAGAIESGVMIKSLQSGLFHPTMNLDNVDPECQGVDHIIGEIRERTVDYAISNSLGFGGHNASLCMKRYTE